MKTSTTLFRACAALGALISAACSTPPNGPEQIADPSVRFPIGVQPQIMALRLPADPANGNPALNSGGQLERLAQDYLEHGSGSIAVSAPRRFPNAPALYAARLEALGIPRARILVGNDDQPGAAEDVRITYIRYRAQSPECGDWSVNQSFTLTNEVPPNFGCATQHNIAAMASDPRDLIAPDSTGEGDAQRRIGVLTKYRQGLPTPAQRTSDQSGFISSVGR